MSANELTEKGCPGLVADIILSTTDLVVNTSRRAEGTVVAASCRAGFVLQGQPVLTCQKNRWSHPTPVCIEPPSSVAEPEDYSLPERDIIIISVCCGVVALILIGLIVCILLYRHLQGAALHKSPVPGARSSLGQYPPYSYNWYLQHGLHPASSVVSASQSRHHPFLTPREKAELGAKHNTGPVYSVIWDPNKMQWHDSFDYSKSTIPRPKLNSTEKWAFPYNYTT